MKTSFMFCIVFVNAIFAFAETEVISSLANSIKIHTTLGYTVIPRDAILEIDVTIYGSITGDPNFRPDFTAKYFGDQIDQVLAPLNMDKPNEMGGPPASMHTGNLVVHYQLDTYALPQTKSFTIENSRALEDSEFPNIMYFPNIRLDRSWLPVN